MILSAARSILPGTSILASPNISPISSQVLGYLNTLVPIDPSVTATSSNYRVNSRFTDSTKGDLRLDWQVRQKDSLFFRVSDRKENAVNFPTLPCLWTVEQTAYNESRTGSFCLVGRTASTQTNCSMHDWLFQA